MDSFDPSHPLTMMFWFATGPKAIEPTSCGRNPLESKAKSLSSFHATYLRHFVIVTESCDTLGSNAHHLQFRDSPGDGILLFTFLCKWAQCLLSIPCFVALPHSWVLPYLYGTGGVQVCFYLFIFKCLFYFYLCVYVCTHVCRFLWRPEDGIRFPGGGVIGACEPPNVGVGN